MWYSTLTNDDDKVHFNANKKKLFDFYLNSMSHLKSKSSSKCYIKMDFIVHKIIMMHAEIVRKKNHWCCIFKGWWKKV